MESAIGALGITVCALHLAFVLVSGTILAIALRRAPYNNEK